MQNNNLAIKIDDYFGSPFGKTAGISDLVSLVVKGAFALSGIVILVLLIIAGISIISSAGKDDPEAAARGKNAATAAVIGFAIIFSAYWIIRIIEIIVRVPFITKPGI